jgi:uncharacterized protein YccT (UPF0319 family)
MIFVLTVFFSMVSQRHMNNTFTIFFSFLLISGFATGCATVSERKNNALAHAATLKVPASVEIVAVNGQKVRIDYIPACGDSVFRLIPGQHSIVLRSKTQSLPSSAIQLAFTAEKNREYAIGCKPPDAAGGTNKVTQSFIAWIEDTKSGKIVSKYDGLAATVIPAANEKIPGVDDKTTQSSLTQMKNLWEKASESERIEFLKWSVMQK